MRQGARLALAMSAMALLASAMADAQIAPGLSGSSTTTYVTDPREYWDTLRSFGACYAKNNVANAWALLATEPNSKEEAAVFKQMRRGQSQVCLTSTSLRAPIPLVRGAIAEGLYKESAAAPAELRQQPPAAGTPILKLGEAARCFVADHRAEAQKLLITTAPGSKQELAALNGMSEGFWSCLPDMAQKRAFNPTQIRYRLAEALLRMPAPAEVQEAAK